MLDVGDISGTAKGKSGLFIASNRHTATLRSPPYAEY